MKIKYTLVTSKGEFSLHWAQVYALEMSSMIIPLPSTEEEWRFKPYPDEDEDLVLNEIERWNNVSKN